MNTILLLAASLSLTTTNDYVLTTPVTTNIIGFGTGPSGDCLIPLAEDVSFLREAYVERIVSLGHPYESDQIGLPPSHVLAECWLPSKVGHPTPGTAVDYMFPATFRGKWFSDSRHSYRASFVNPSAKFPNENYWETGPDYIVNGQSTDATNGLSAFASISGWRVSPGLVSTNVHFFGPVTRARVMCAYSNVAVRVAILTNPDNAYGRYYVSTLERSHYRGWNRPYFTPTGPVEYTYKDANGNKKTSIYYSSYEYPQQEYYENTYTSRYDREASSITSLRAENFRRALVPYTYRIMDGGTRYKAFPIGNPINQWDWQYTDRFSTGGCMEFISDVLTSNTNRIEDEEIDVCVVYRFRCIKTEAYTGCAVGKTTVSTNHYVGLVNAKAKRLSTDITRWETNEDVLNDIWSDCHAGNYVETVSWPAIDSGKLPPEETDAQPAQFYEAMHIREVMIRKLEVFVYAFFVPTFNARVI